MPAVAPGFPPNFPPIARRVSPPWWRSIPAPVGGGSSVEVAAVERWLAGLLVVRLGGRPNFPPRGGKSDRL